MGRERRTHGGNGWENILTKRAETPDDNSAQGRHHHPNCVLRIGFVTHHSNQEQRHEDAAQTVDSEHDQGKDGVAKAGELLAAQCDDGDEDSDDHGDEFRGFVLL